jgi:hypothetical protein
MIFEPPPLKGCESRPSQLMTWRRFVEHAVGVAASAIIRGSPWDDETETALEAAKRETIAELMGNEPYHPTPEEQQDAWATEHECYRLGLMP